MNAFTQNKTSSFQQLGDKQLERNDCGVSAIKSLHNMYGVPCHRSSLREKLHFTKEGATFSSVKKLLDEKGFTTKYRVVSNLSEHLESISESLPAIAVMDGGAVDHYVVIHGLTPTDATIMDPEDGKFHTLSLSHFENRLKQMSAPANNELIAAFCQSKVEEFFKKWDLSNQPKVVNKHLLSQVNRIIYIEWLEEKLQQNINKQLVEDIMLADNDDVIPERFKRLTLSDLQEYFIHAPVILNVSLPGENKRKLLSQLDSFGQGDSKNGSTNDHKVSIKQVFVLICQDIGTRKLLQHFLLISLLVSFASYLFVYTNQFFIDEIFPKRHIDTLYIFIFIILILRVTEFLFHFAQNFTQIALEQSIDKVMFNRLFSIFDYGQIGHLNSFSRGDISQRVNDSLKIKSLVTRYFNDVVINVITIVSTTILVSFYSLKVTAIVFAVAVIYTGLFFSFTPIIRTMENKRFHAKGKIITNSLERVEGASLLRNELLSRYFTERDELDNGAYLAIQRKSKLLVFAVSYGSRFIAVLAGVALLLLTAREVFLENSLSLGQVLAVIALTTLAFTAMRNFLKTYLSIQESLVVFNRFTEFCKTPKRTIIEKTKQVALGKIVINNLVYESGESLFSLRVPELTLDKKQKILIKGLNGSGKSTLFQLITGMIESDSINGVAYIDSAGSPQSFANVVDDMFIARAEDVLFAETLYFNITLGQNFDKSTIYQMAKEIGAEDFINEATKSLERKISANGSNLSTGQKRKIILLRAFLSNATFVFLDEVFRGVDRESKKKIVSYLNTITDKTFLFTSHESLPGIQLDNIYTIDKGVLRQSTIQLRR